MTAPGEWRDIADAPRDGTVIFALWPYTPTQCAFETRWHPADDTDAAGWSAKNWGHILDGYEPSHWLPLPAPPSAT